MFALFMIPAAVFAAVAMFLHKLAAWFGFGPEVGA